MSVAYYSETSNVTRDQVQRASEYINGQLGGSPPDGALFHADGPTDHGGWWSFDIYASDEQFSQFYESILSPAFTHADMDTIPFRRLEVSWDSTQVPGSSQ